MEEDPPPQECKNTKNYDTTRLDFEKTSTERLSECLR